VRHFGPEAAAAQGGPPWLVKRRAEAVERLGALALPTADGAEVWRYSPIDQLNLDAYQPAAVSSAPPAPALARALGPGALVRVAGGRVISIERDGLPPGVVVGTGLERPPDELGTVVGQNDFFVALNDAFCPEVVVVEVPPGTVLDRPVVIVHWVEGAGPDGPAPCALPRTYLHVGEGAQAQVVEVFLGGAQQGRSLVVPVGEAVVEDRGRLAYVMVQDLGPASWQLARLGTAVGRDATLQTFTAGLGAAYGRVRVDALTRGEGGATELTSVYLGAGDQVHDVRTMQDHAAPRTTSDLLCKGAVAERANSVYSGLIRVRHGAVRADAMQTNHNLVLDERARAFSLPILDIEENDVRCSHASSVGPLNEDQRYYLESRGLAPERAERLIVLGFFEDVVDRAPVASARQALRSGIAGRLEELLEQRGGSDG
jgi:Fe-S cluster assembly protein SufD